MLFQRLPRLGWTALEYLFSGVPYSRCIQVMIASDLFCLPDVETVESADGLIRLHDSPVIQLVASR
jgi:hypothetical protein